MAKNSRETNFKARANVWSTYERMSHELGIEMDELINEAMVAYAKQRGYSTDEAPLVGPAAGRPFEDTQNSPPSVSPLDRAYAADDSGEDDEFARTSTRMQPARPAAGRSALADPSMRTTAPPARLPAALARMPTAPRRPLEPPASVRMPAATAPPPPAPPILAPIPPPGPNRPAPPPLPRVAPGSMSTNANRDPREAATKRLSLTYRGRTVDVEKQRFLIGRSKTQADLLVDDPNVSRQHAAIERVGYVYYLVDLGSTNGVQIANERITRKALNDGDVISITSHEIRCSLR